MTTFNWIGGSENWDTPGGWSPSGPPMASDVASIGDTATTETIVVSNAQAVTTVMLDNPNAEVAIGGATGANLTVAHTLAIEYGSVGLGGLGTLGAAHIRIAAPKGSPTPTDGVLFFLGNGTIGATVENNGTIEAKGQAGSTVDFERKVIGKGSADISGGGTLEFTKRVEQTIAFGAGGGTLELLDPLHQTGHINGFATGDTISLAGDWIFSSPLFHPTHATTELTLTSGSEIHQLLFAGDYKKSDFAIASGATTTIKFA